MASAQGGARPGFFSRLTSGIGLGSGNACVGLSIGASSIKIAELKRKGKSQWELLHYAAVPVQNVFSEQREVVNAQALVFALREVIAQSGIKAKDVCSAVLGSGVIIKTLNILCTDMRELNDQVFWEAEQYIPFDINEVVIDYHIVKKSKDNNVEVLLVAVKREYLDQFASILKEAKLNPKVMDVEVFALQNSFETNYPVSDTEATLLVDVGALSTKSIICAGGAALFCKDSSYGGMMVTGEIERDLKLSSTLDAEALKTSQNLPHEVSEIVIRTGHILATELKKSIDFYTASSLGPPVTSIYLSGGGSRAVHLSKMLEDYLKLPVLYMNPFEKITSGSKELTSEFLDSVSLEACIPIGLAIRAGEKVEVKK